MWKLARLRVKTGCKIPDCCVLASAPTRGTAVATFDEQQRIDRRFVDLDTDGHQIGPHRVCDIVAYGSDEHFRRCDRAHEQRR